MESLRDILRRLQLRNTSGVTAYPAERSLESEPECSLCGGRGWVRVDVPLGHADFGKAHPCACQQEVGQAQRLARLQRYGNMAHLSHLTFNALDPNGRSEVSENRRCFAQTLEAAKAYAENPKGWLVITGASGLGKTHLAAAIANRSLERGAPAFFVVVADLMDHLRAAFAPSAEVSYDQLFEQVRGVPLLVLDDLGAYNTTPWAQEKLFQVLNHRYNLRLSTIITTTLQLGEIDERLRTRLSDPAIAQVCSVGEESAAVGPTLWEVEPALLERMTFDAFSSHGHRAATTEDRQTLAAALRAARSFAEEPDKWLVLLGETGVGKTHLAVAIYREQQRQGHQPFFVSVADLLDHLRRAFSPESRVTYDELFERVKGAPLLILDDLGAQSATPWANEKLYQIIVHRHNARLPTVITTRAMPPSVVERDGHPTSSALGSRLNDIHLVNVVSMQAPDYRTGERVPSQEERRDTPARRPGPRQARR